MSQESNKAETDNLRKPKFSAQLQILLQQIHGQSSLISSEEKNLAKYSNYASIFMITFATGFNLYTVLNKKANLSSKPYFMKISTFIFIVTSSLVTNSLYQMYRIKSTVIGLQIIRQRAIQKMIKLEQNLQQQKRKSQQQRKRRIKELYNQKKQATQARLSKQLKTAQSKAEKVI